MIDDLQESFALKKLCRAFGVHRSSFQYWRDHTSQRQSVCPLLAAEIKRAFNASNGSAGSRNIAAMVTTAGIELTRHRASKAMKALGLKSSQPPRVINKNKGDTHVSADNILNRDFDVGAPNKVWCTDVTYIWAGDRWAYLAVVLDLYARRPVGWAVSSSPDSSLTIKALEQAFISRGRPTEVLLHSDQGSHFTSKAYRKRLKRYGMTHSMSRRGNCWDNAPMERFFRSFKTEWMPKNGWASQREVKHHVNNYILQYYNKCRPHQHNSGLSPAVKEAGI